MDYRNLPHGEEPISVIGFGTSSIGAAGSAELDATLELALEQGINYFDLASADAAPFPALGRVLGERRGQVYFQIHFGADYSTGKYGWTTSLDAIKRSVGWQLEQLETDYIDFAFLHCLDEEADLRRALEGGTLDYILSLKQQGVVRHIGMSSHTPAVAQMGLDTGLLDMLMFSINPAYDYQRKGEYAIGGARERQALYRRCQAEGVGISVMKAFSGGQLLSGKTSPFGRALTEHQCIQYALDRPGVLTVLPGVRDREDLRRILGYLHAGAEARDYSVFAELTPAEAAGSCVYCNHCHPCPGGLDIGLINKYYDLAQAGDRLAADHYVQLEKHAGDCTRCGHCDRRCPFHVRQSERMKQIREYFGR